ncbi:MAG: hypothetical protein AABW80_03420 [Nanoarchaeota archaeon]
MEIKKAIEDLRNEEKRKFTQSFDLIINLKGLDLKRDSVSTIINLPHVVKKKNVCGFFEEKNSNVKTVTKADFPKYKDKKPLKELIREYDFFIAEAKLMPAVATTFGKSLGPLGKMPSPQLGVLPVVNDAAIKVLLTKIDGAVKIRVKEASVKVSVGTEKMKDEEIIENIKSVYDGLLAVLPIRQDNVRNVMVKLTMSKPKVVEVK